MGRPNQRGRGNIALAEVGKAQQRADDERTVQIEKHHTRRHALSSRASNSAADSRAGVSATHEAGHADTAYAVMSGQVEVDSQTQWRLM